MATSLHVAEPISPSVSLPIDRRASLRPLLPWLLIGFAGLVLVASSLLWRIWTTDALRSVGLYFPIVSIVLTLRVWRRLGWETEGTWWGTLPLLYAVVMAREGGNAIQALAVTSRGALSLLPLGLTVFAFGSGVVLLLGGTRVWRAALFPLVLLLLVNPVPKAFAVVDLPLQYFCAHVAHSFALAIGVRPDTDQLRMMFAPGFGMFIAPGCDGIRGAVTMGYLALVLGYLYRFSLRARVLSVLGAVALGYVFNLVRLCFLVLFYRVALRFPALQAHGEGADYLIGGLLFLSAAILFTRMVRWNRKDNDPASGGAPRMDSSPRRQPKDSALPWKGATVALLVILTCFSCLPSIFAMARENKQNDGTAPLPAILPQAMGQYKLLRTWSEQDWLNHLAYRWGAYSAGNSGDEIDVAFWLGPGVHYPIACHIAKGQRPDWQQLTTLPTAAGGSATFDLNFYADPYDPALEATTVCDKTGCREHVLLPGRSGLAFAGMGIKDLLFQPASTPLPVLIRIRAGAAASGSEAMRTQMVSQFQDFIAHADTSSWVHFAESRNHH